MAVMLAAALRAELGVEVPLAGLFEHTALSAQAQWLEQLGSTAAPRDAAPVAAISTFNPAAQTTVFCFPPLLGYGFVFEGLARWLPQFCVYALDFSHEAADPFAHFIAAIERTQPSGPLRLLGYSAGGVAAYETARRLCALGRKVSDLVLLDAAFVSERKPLSDAELDAMVADNLEHFAAHMLDDPRLLRRFGRTQARKEMAAKLRNYCRLLDRLQPAGPVAARGHVVLAEDSVEEGRVAWDGLLSGPVTCHRGTGRHLDMLVGEHARHNAALIAAALGAGSAQHEPLAQS